MCFCNSSPINGFIPWGNYHEQIIIGLLLLIVTINTVVSLYCFKKSTILNVQGCKIKEIHPFCLSFLGLCYFWNRLYSNNYVRIVSKDERSDKAHWVLRCSPDLRVT